MKSLDRRFAWAGALGVAVLLVVGWRELLFLTDDAFIAFRYVSNGVAGLGYVWNPPPFRPVEGYTSFLWVALLDGTWRLTGVLPPRSSVVFSLVASAGTLGLAAILGLRMRLPERAEASRGALVLLALVGTVTNGTFLAWTSSGLETALFAFLVTAWIAAAIAAPPGTGRGLSLSAAAAASALTRPDGILLALGTPVLLVLERRTPFSAPRLALPAIPLLAVPVHLLWRKATYGEWLPNTYYAKYVAPWPESGARYALSFVLEYAFWTIAALAGAWAVGALRERRRALGATAGESGGRRRELLVVVAVLAAHFLYYTLRIGGDHFEYRVYAHLVPLLFLAAAWLSARVFRAPRRAVLSLAAVVALSWPIPWTLHVVSQERTTRAETRKMAIPLAASFPVPLRPYVAAWDALQEWMIRRLVCVRRREHEVFCETLLRSLPDRATGSEVGWEGRPVIASDSVGVVAWVYPHAAVVDVLGLNDLVIARTPPRPEAPREMAHERWPPQGYVECFRPNWNARSHRFTPRPLADAEIVACEDRWRVTVR